MLTSGGETRTDDGTSGPGFACVLALAQGASEKVKLRSFGGPEVLPGEFQRRQHGRQGEYERFGTDTVLEAALSKNT